MQEFPYWQRQEKKPLFLDIEWNLPEQKTGAVTLVGGNSQSFSGIVKDAEYLLAKYPVKSVKLVLPETLRGKLPIMDNVIFAPATESGSLAASGVLGEAMAASDLVILPGELSRNSATEVAVTQALMQCETFVAVTGDAVEAVTAEATGVMERGNICVLASLAQLQKLFKALYYPKMLLLSMPLMAVVETLHKFTLSYPGVTVVTLQAEQVVVASKGKVVTTALEHTEFTPVSLWFGNLVCRLGVMNMFSPGKGVEASSFAVVAG